MDIKCFIPLSQRLVFFFSKGLREEIEQEEEKNVNSSCQREQKKSFIGCVSSQRLTCCPLPSTCRGARCPAAATLYRFLFFTPFFPSFAHRGERQAILLKGNKNKEKKEERTVGTLCFPPPSRNKSLFMICFC